MKILKAICWIVLAAVLSIALAPPAPAFNTLQDKACGSISQAGECLERLSKIVQVKWAPGAFPIHWKLNTTELGNITGSSRSLEAVLQASFARWQAVTTANVTFAQDANVTGTALHSSNDEINLIKTNLSVAQFEAIAGNALGVALSAWDDTGALVDVDILFNPGTLFSKDTPPDASRIDLESVATHEIGHLLGLDHSNILSATMFPSIGPGLSYARVLSMDDIAGVSSIYPTTAYLARGSISGTVRLTTNPVVYGAMVVAVNSNGEPVASAMTDPQGNYTIRGLDAGTYSIFAEPMDLPFSILDLSSPDRIYPNATVTTGFTTRFR